MRDEMQQAALATTRGGAGAEAGLSKAHPSKGKAKGFGQAKEAEVALPATTAAAGEAAVAGQATLQEALAMNDAVRHAESICMQAYKTRWVVGSGAMAGAGQDT